MRDRLEAAICPPASLSINTTQLHDSTRTLTLLVTSSTRSRWPSPDGALASAGSATPTDTGNSLAGAQLAPTNKINRNSTTAAQAA